MENNLNYILKDSEENTQETIIFTPEERARIDRLLVEGEEYQRTHGNKQYTIEEMWGEIMEQHYKFLQEFNR